MRKKIPLKVGPPHVMPSNYCAWCAQKVFKASLVANRDDPDHTPKAGEFSLCVSCGRFNTYAADLSLRRPTTDEIHQIGTDPIARALRLAWFAMDRLRTIKAGKP
jgi:hypothetical protein